MIDTVSNQTGMPFTKRIYAILFYYVLLRFLSESEPPWMMDTAMQLRNVRTSSQEQHNRQHPIHVHHSRFAHPKKRPKHQNGDRSKRLGEQVYLSINEKDPLVVASIIVPSIKKVSSVDLFWLSECRKFRKVRHAYVLFRGNCRMGLVKNIKPWHSQNGLSKQREAHEHKRETFFAISAKHRYLGRRRWTTFSPNLHPK